MAVETTYSYYWNCRGEHTKGPQPCACGGPSDCPKREEHIKKAIKEMDKPKPKE